MAEQKKGEWGESIIDKASGLFVSVHFNFHDKEVAIVNSPFQEVN